LAPNGARGGGNFVLIQGGCNGKSVWRIWSVELGGAAEIAWGWQAEAEVDIKMKF